MFVILACEQLEVKMPSSVKSSEENTFKNRLLPVRGKGLCYLDHYGLETVRMNFTLKPVAEACKRSGQNLQKGILYLFKFQGKLLSFHFPNSVKKENFQTLEIMRPSSYPSPSSQVSKL